MMYNPIKIQKGNDCELRIQPRMEDGTAIPASALSNIVVKFGCAGTVTQQSFTLTSDRICIALTDSQALGTYDIYMHAKIGTRDIEDNRKCAFSRVAWGEGVPDKTYDTDWLIVGQSDAETEALKESLTEAIADANEAKEEAEELAANLSEQILRITDIAKETTSQSIKTLVQAIPTSQPTDYAKETTAEAARVAAVAAKTAAENITIPADVARKTDLPTDYAKAASIPTVEQIQSGLAKSSDVEDLATESQVGNVHEDVRIVAENVEAIKADYAKSTDIPTDYAKTTDLPTDYAKEATFTTWATGLWASFKSAVESFITRTNAALGQDTPASGEGAKSLHTKVDEIAAKITELGTSISAIKVGMVIVNQTATSGLTLESGTTSVWASPIASLSFNLLSPSNGTEAHYRLRFKVSTASFSFDSPTLIGTMPTWDTTKTYEMDIMSDGTNNYALVKEW